jgi:hypothetical protein
MTILSTEYQERAEREQREADKHQERIRKINAKRSMPHPSGIDRPKFDGRTTKEVFETIRYEKRRPT